jgi:hypothetical protein
VLPGIGGGDLCRVGRISWLDGERLNFIGLDDKLAVMDCIAVLVFDSDAKGVEGVDGVSTSWVPPPLVRRAWRRGFGMIREASVRTVIW